MDDTNEGDDMKDDDREIGWAPRQIRKLQADHIEAAKAIDAISEELAGTDIAVSHLNDRISKVENAPDWLAIEKRVWSRTVSELKMQIGDMQDQIRAMTPYVEMTQRVKRLESQTQFETSEDDARLKDLELRLSKMMSDPAPWEPEFSPPVGGRKYQPDLDDEADGIPDVHGRSPGPWSWRESIARGCRFCVLKKTWTNDAEFIDHLRDHLDERQARYDKIRTTTLGLAEQRVRNYMKDHFSTATIEGVISAIHGKGGGSDRRTSRGAAAGL